jgi:hypothetical protein
MTTFSVDTHLFRELGELLVGRDSTALIELIKNAYDADATTVVVYGESLSHVGRGYITITDNGIGMSLPEFEKGFLTIASRTKDDHSRRSKVFERRYTGQKGVGRLAAHKLARVLEVNSSRWSGIVPTDAQSEKLSSKGESVDATIDWDKVEASQTLADVDKTDAIKIQTVSGGSTTAGTSITLRNLRRRWTPSEHGRFLEELQAFQPPPPLLEPIPKNVCKPLLFDVPRVRDISSKAGQRFFVELEGDLAPPDDYWTAMVEAATWIIEIDADIHEINGLLEMAGAMEKSLSTISTMQGLPKEHRRQLATLQRDVGDLKRAVERQASYLVDVVTPDARRRRSRQVIADRFETGVKLIASSAERRGIKILNNIPHDLRSRQD